MKDFKFAVLRLNHDQTAFEVYRIFDDIVEARSCKALLPDNFKPSVLPFEDLNKDLERRNSGHTTLVNTVNNLNRMVDIIDEYFPIYADYFEANYSKFKFKDNGDLYKKDAEALRALPRPDNIHRFKIEKNGWLTVSIWTGHKYIENCYCVFNTYSMQKLEKPALKRFTILEYINHLELINSTDREIHELESKLRKLKSEAGV